MLCTSTHLYSLCAAHVHAPTILILEKLTRPSSVKFGVPSSIKAKSVRYIPRYGTQGGLQLGGNKLH